MHNSQDEDQWQAPAPGTYSRRRWIAAANWFLKINVVVSISAAFVEAAFDPLAWFAAVQFWLSLFLAAIMQPGDDRGDVAASDGSDSEFRRVM